jgi:hypothetical protein
MGPRKAVVKNGDMERTSSCAAKSRPSLPMVKVTIREVRELETGELSNDFFNFASFASRSREDFFNFVAFSTRSLVRNERLNMAAVWVVDVEDGVGIERDFFFPVNERRKEREESRGRN